VHLQDQWDPAPGDSARDQRRRRGVRVLREDGIRPEATELGRELRRQLGVEPVAAPQQAEPVLLPLAPREDAQLELLLECVELLAQALVQG
jgi:hypothetical protein